MTPEQRRTKHPLPAVTAMTVDEEAELRQGTESWLSRPDFTDRTLDHIYHRYARLLATLDAARTETPGGTR